MRVAVIGAGSLGLESIKSCKEENLDVICYERSDNIGGLWRYRDSDKEGLASVTKSTIINSSKELSAISDFPPPKEFPNYMHNTMMFKYFQLFAEKFDLIPHIKFHHRVERVIQADDYDLTGKWKVTALNLNTGKEVEETVDAIMVCTGHHVFPNMPKFPAQENFKGRIIHTHSYKKVDDFRDKKVVVIGAGNSATDAAVETSYEATKVYLSTRRGCWVLRRVSEYGEPNDEHFTTRFFNILFNLVPISLSSWYMERILNKRFNHDTYQLKPEHRFFQQHPVVNDSLPARILCGMITVKSNIERFEENGVVFEGENQVTEVDSVIFATGYEIKFPFLGRNIIDTTDNRVELYKLVFPPNLKHPTLAFIGLFQSVGALFPVGEMQIRWVVQVFKKKLSLPSESEMREDIEMKLEKIRKRYYNSKRHTIQVDYINYLDEIASLIGVKPQFVKMMFKDPKLFWALMMGPSLPYQYRLRGPHAWDKARETILCYKNRVNYPLQTRYRKVEKNVNTRAINRYIFCLLFFIFCLNLKIISVL